MFRIAAYPKCFERAIGVDRTMTLFEWIEIARNELDVEALQLYDRFLIRSDSSYLRQVKDAIEGAGFIVPMFMGSPDFTQPDPDARKRAIEYQVRMIELTKYFGGKGAVCRILSGQRYPEVSRAEGVEWVVDAFNQVLPVAREYGVVLGMENHYKDIEWSYAEFAQKMDVFLEIINAIPDREYFGVQYDPSNAIVAAEDPLALLDIVKERVVSMHASDRSIKPGFSPEDLLKKGNDYSISSMLVHGVVGTGLNNYERIFALLAQAKFGGWVTIEDGVNGIDEIQASLDFLRKMQSKYFGGLEKTQARERRTAPGFGE